MAKPKRRSAQEASRNEVAGAAGGILRSLVESSKSKLAESRRRGEEAMTYYKANDYDYLYKSVSDDLSFRACVKKVWEAFTILVGYMTPDDPHREIDYRPRRVEPGSLEDMRQIAGGKRISVVQDYLNWTVSETDFRGHIRRAILDFLARGRGVLWTGIHPRKDVITTLWDAENNFITDPNAMMPEDSMFKGQTMVMPRSRAYQLWPNAENIIRAAKKTGTRFTETRSDPHGQSKVHGSLDCIKLHRVYMLNSLTDYNDGAALRDVLMRTGVSDEQIKQQMLSPDPMLYVFTDDGVLIDVGPWEVPLWRDGLWPCTEIAAYDDNSSMTPISPLDAAMKFTAAINWLVTLTMGKARTTMRLLLATVNQNGQGLDDASKVKALIGQDLESIHINAVGEKGGIGEYIQQFRWDNGWIGDSLNLIRFFEQKFDELSGISQIMRSGEPGTQDRSAEATRLRRELSFNRADDMRGVVMRAHDEIARKEGIYLQFLKDGDYISSIFGEQAGTEFGFLATKEDQDPNKWMAEFVEEGMAPEVAGSEAMMRAVRAYTVEDIMHEASYSVAVGEGPRHDRAARVEAYDRFLNQTAPSMMQTGDPNDAAAVFRITAGYFDEVGMDQEHVRRLRERADSLEQVAATQAQQAQMMGAPAQEGPTDAG